MKLYTSQTQLISPCKKNQASLSKPQKPSYMIRKSEILKIIFPKEYHRKGNQNG